MGLMGIDGTSDSNSKTRAFAKDFSASTSEVLLAHNSRLSTSSASFKQRPKV